MTTINTKERSVLAVCATLALLSACQRSEPPAPAKDEPVAEAAAASVVLTPEQIEKMGIATTAAATMTLASEAAGYGVVLAHDVIAQAVADIATAEAAAHQSRAALTRVRNLADTLGAFSAETLETAQRQAAADAAALTLAQRKLSATFGQNQPWQGGQGSKSGAMLDEVASGQSKLVRATFPLGVLPGPIPHSLRIARPDPSGSEKGWKTSTIWAAPADATIPGRSLFALLKDGNGASDVGEGERLDVWAAAGPSESGILVPQAAVVISDGNYWCYVENQPGTFTRTAIDASKAVAGGFLVTEGIAAGHPIVTTGAGLLLARETNPATEAE
jgi:hypothetical protein